MTRQNKPTSAQSNESIDAASLLSVIEQLAHELNPANSPKISLDSTLDRDLGFDSLSRAELLLRIEQTFAVHLPEHVLVRAETARDLLREARMASPAGATAEAEAFQTVRTEPSVQPILQVPEQAETLVDVLEWHRSHNGSRAHVYLYSSQESTPQSITYQQLAERAQTLAAGLQSLGIEPQQTVALMLPTSADYLYSFFAVLLCNAIPVPIYPPARPSQLEEHLLRHSKILDNAQARVLITVDEAKPVAKLLSAQVVSIHSVVTPDEIRAQSNAFLPVTVMGSDIAFLQYTSGSTGQPKGVILTHQQLLANIRAMGEANQVTSDDCFVSWLPLYHDMGLIGAWFGSLYFAITLVLMSPLAFLSKPERWLKALHQHKATLTAAPNFAYELCIRKVTEQTLRGLDLNSLRRIFNGAEPVNPNTIDQFISKFAQAGLKPNAMIAVYGLAEAAVGLAFPPATRGIIFDTILRDEYETASKAIPAEQAHSEQAVMRIPACGYPLPGYQFRVVDPAGHELPERRVGQLQFKGPSATSGYFRNPEATAQLFAGDWLNTGDLAYTAQGDLYITGRTKELIIRGGRNIYPYEIETAVGELTAIRKGCVAVFGAPAKHNDSGGERLIVVAEVNQRVTQETSFKPDTLIHSIRHIAAELTALPADQVLLVPPHAVLKTSSGKIRRAAMRELFLSGHLETQDMSTGRKLGKSRALWWQLVRLNIRALGPRLRKAMQTLGDQCYSRYALLIYWLLGPVIWFPSVLLPKLSWRWATMRFGAKLLFRLTRIRINCAGLENLPEDQHGIIVANHASYIDGIALVAMLPGRFSFVAKEQLKEKPIARWFLTRIGAHFVERFDPRRGLEDAAELQAALESGHTLMYFPEGTFTRSPGLLPFRMGAFLLAAEQQVPIFPVTIRGTRSIMRDDERFIRHGRIQLDVAPAITTPQAGWPGALELRDACRRVMLEKLGEPDIKRSPFQDVADKVNSGQ